MCVCVCVCVYERIRNYSIFYSLFEISCNFFLKKLKSKEKEKKKERMFIINIYTAYTWHVCVYVCVYVCVCAGGGGGR